MVIEVAIIRRQGLFLSGEFQVHYFPNMFQGSFVYTRAGNLSIYILLDALVTGGVWSAFQIKLRPELGVMMGLRGSVMKLVGICQ